NMVQSLEIYKAIAAKEKIDIVDIESFSTKDTDFSAQLTKVKSMDVDAIFTGAYPDTGASILTQAAKLGLPKKTVFVGGNGFNSPKIIELAGASAEGLVVSSPWFIDRKDPENVEFISLYRKKFKEDPDTYAAQGYQGLMLMVTAIETSPLKTPASIRDTLAKSRIHGLFGDFSFAPNRDPSGVGNAVTLQVKDGKFAPM
ncbi:ABC transporter substrate-binding protein, partial [Glaciimonas sp. CA11.2]